MKYKALIDRLYALRFHKDRQDHHPERNVLEHSLQALRIAQKEAPDNRELQVATLFHDIGKSIETLGHDKLSVDILKSFGYYSPKVHWLIENHIRIIWWLDGSMVKQKKVQELLNNKWFKNLVHLRRIDFSARVPNKTTIVDKQEIQILLEETNE